MFIDFLHLGGLLPHIFWFITNNLISIGKGSNTRTRRNLWLTLVYLFRVFELMRPAVLYCRLHFMSVYLQLLIPKATTSSITDFIWYQIESKLLQLVHAGTYIFLMPETGVGNYQFTGAGSSLRRDHPHPCCCKKLIVIHRSLAWTRTPLWLIPAGDGCAYIAVLSLLPRT